MSASDYLDLCTIELVCARDNKVVVRLKVEMRAGTHVSRAGNLYRKLRVSEAGTTPQPHEYDWAAAFAEPSDKVADGMTKPLTVSLKVGEGHVLRHWQKQDVKVKVRRGQTVQIEFLATEPVGPQARPRAQANPWDGIDAEAAKREEQRQQEQTRRARSGNAGWSDAFDGLFGNFALGGQAKPQPQGVNAVWIEIEAVLKRKRFTCKADIGRARRAMALLLHSDAAGNPLETDALARANAYLDEREKAFKPAIDAA